jgi:putative membrane protein
MRSIRKILFVLVTIILVLPTFLVSADSDDSKSEVDAPQENGIISSKDEVVYAKLSATGERQEIYVVNIIDIEKAGKVFDYGPYTNLKNLTDLAQLELKDQQVEFVAQEGKFYYQGNMNEEHLPWNILIRYFLDGKEINPKELAGKDGHIVIRIATSANESVDPLFFKNYLLQISLPLNLDLYSNIRAPKGMLANAGKNKQVTFTVMPEKEEELVLDADVIDFELEGIDITAIPSSMSIDAPDIDEMTGEMETLADAIKEIDNGVGDLNDGVRELNNGVKALGNGSKEYKDGIHAIASSSSELINASVSIDQALDTMVTSLSGSSEDTDIGDLKQLEEGLVQISGGLKETSNGLETLKGNYANAYGALNKSMVAIPDYVISEEQIKQLYASGADKTILDQLIETYSAARTAKGTYLAVKEAFDAVVVTLNQVSGSLTEMANTLDAMANGLSSSQEDMDVSESFAQLQDGLSQLSSNYKEFHSGLIDYTGGVGQLSGVYGEVHTGIQDLYKGTSELEKGISKLHDGTSELNEATDDLPEQMKQEVDKMMADYDKSDFEAVSFVSPKNENIHLVQFVLKTETIKKDEPEEKEDLVQETKGFWARLMELFK